MLRLVIFDFDGVITDTEPAHYETLRRVLQQEGIEINWQQYCDKYMAYDDRDCFIQALTDGNREMSKDLIASLVSRKKEFFAQYLTKNLVILPGVNELLENIARHHIPCSICSGSFRSEIDFILRKSGLTNYFKVIAAADDVTAGKPDPQGYRICLSRINQLMSADQDISPNQCVVIEDSVGGIKAAKTAGMYCLAVANSYPEELLFEADRVVKDLTSVNVDTLQKMVK